MKPKNLKCPFTWETRRPMLCDRVLYVPEYYDRHQDYAFPGWSEIFASDAPVEVEYCTGNGAWIVEKALQCPERNWVAVELQFERVRKIWSKIHNLGLKNLLAVSGEGSTFARHYVPKGSIAAAYVNFPDPWPKEKHAKNRLLKEPFIAEVSKTLVVGGVLTIVTDHAEYMRQILQVMLASPLWEARFPHPHYVQDYEGYGTSYFDALWREQGVPVHYMQFYNRGKP